MIRINPSYTNFGVTLYIKGGGGGGGGVKKLSRSPITVSAAHRCVNVTLSLIKSFLFGCHGNCSMTNLKLSK